MKKRNGTVEGQRDWGMQGEHIYVHKGENGETSKVYVYADSFGEILVSVEAFDAVMSKEGYTRV